MNSLLKILLWGPSKLYQSVVWTRNLLFDKGLVKSTSFDAPFVLSVGNITVGGTGKTPHVEYLIRLLSERYRLAVLSRGYRRKTKGYLLANEMNEVTAAEIGDEPYQIFSKFQNLQVAVDENRVDGISRLRSLPEPPQIVLLDDAFQHRYLKPNFSVVLCDFNRPPFADSMLPMGQLREPLAGLKRADVVVVTKCPHHLSSQEFQFWRQKLQLQSSQPLFSSVVDYDHPQGLRGEMSLEALKENGNKVVLLTGIANPKPLYSYLSSHGVEYSQLKFADHHNFSFSDIQTIQKACGSDSILLTTEKDFVRLKTILPAQLQERTFFLPIRVILSEGFDQTILSQLP